MEVIGSLLGPGFEYSKGLAHYQCIFCPKIEWTSQKCIRLVIFHTQFAWKVCQVYFAPN